MTVYNMPSYSTNQLGIGQAKIYIGFDGASPAKDVGAIKSHSFVPSQETLKVPQGFPSHTIHSWRIQEDGTLNVEFLQTHDIDHLYWALGGGCVTTAGTSVLEWGGDAVQKEFTLKLVHTQPRNSGTQWQFKFWKVKIDALPEIGFANDAERTYNVSFQLYDAGSRWDGSNTEWDRLFRVESHAAGTTETG